MFSDLRSELRSGFSGLWIAMFAFVGFACTAPSEVDPLPAGAYVAGRVAALKPLLKGLQSLVGTSLAYRAFEIESRLSDCEEFAGASKRCGTASPARALQISPPPCGSYKLTRISSSSLLSADPQMLRTPQAA